MENVLEHFLVASRVMKNIQKKGFLNAMKNTIKHLIK
jgi:hypothetical protein